MKKSHSEIDDAYLTMLADGHKGIRSSFNEEFQKLGFFYCKEYLGASVKKRIGSKKKKLYDAVVFANNKQQYSLRYEILMNA